MSASICLLSSEISYPNSGYIKLGTNVSVRFWVYNVTDGSLLTNTTVNCTYNLITPTGLNSLRVATPASSGIRFAMMPF
jgi:hypothetical protein